MLKSIALKEIINMKVKKLLGIALLAGSLLLSSCDLLSSLTNVNKNKSRDEESSENNNGSNIGSEGYQGRKGATQLSADEWKLAFSLEELALRRKVKTSVTQNYITMVTEFDYGKVSVRQVYQGQESSPSYSKFKSVTDGVLNYDAYLENATGWEVTPQSHPLDYIMSQLGLLEYKQSNFTYDSNTKTYVAASFTHSITYSGETMSLVIKNATITIEDGLPKNVDFDFNNQDTSLENIHCVVTFSDYGNVVVTLPEVANNNQNQNQGYQGKQGVTELTREEWEQAFSLKEQALYRSFVYGVQSSQSTYTSIEFDHGKVKYDNVITQLYYKFDGVANGIVSGTSYAVSNGIVATNPVSEQLDLLMAQFGIINYNYNDFTYNPETKKYTASRFTYKIESKGETALSLIGSNAVIEIENGLPKSIRFDYINEGDDVGSMQYMADYSNYNAVAVSIPSTGGNGGNNNNHLNPEGKQITYMEFAKAYNERSKAPYNHVSYSVSNVSISGQSGSGYQNSADLVNGEWVTNGSTDNQLLPSDYIFTDNHLASFKAASNGQIEGYSIEFYYNSPENEYIVYVNYAYQADSTYEALIYLDQYFYFTKEIAYRNDMHSTINIYWSTL